MKKPSITLITLGLVSAMLWLAPSISTAEEKPSEKPAAKSADAKKDAPKPEKKPRATPFRGKISAVDKTAGTITVGTRTFVVTPETKITKDDHAATLDDAVVGENATGSYLKGEDGKLNASSLRLNVHIKTPGSSNTEKKTEKKEK